MHLYIKSPFPLSTEAPTDILISLIIVIMTWFGGQAAFTHFYLTQRNQGSPLPKLKALCLLAALQCR